MAAADAHPWPIKGAAYRVTFDLRLTTGALNAGATGLDSEVSKDAGTFVDCVNEAVEIATGSGVYYLDLTAGEMNADTVAVVVKSTNSNNMTQTIVLYPVALLEPTAVPAWPMSMESAISWIAHVSKARQLATATTATLRNDADTATTATATLSDDGTTYTKGRWT